jgi:predicted phage terminase large subunit-like protein
MTSFGSSLVSQLLSNPQLIRNELARRNFSEFRKAMNPDIRWGWFTQDISDRLQAFYEAWQAGERPKLILQAPPQHGKSSAVVDFIAWASGKTPETRTIFASFSENLGIRANRQLQRIFDSSRYKAIFPEFEINSQNTVTVSGRMMRNQAMIENSMGGYFRNTTVAGAITGESLDLGVIDDPIKGRKIARSRGQRDTVWEWLTDDFLSRFSEHAAMLMVLTRWHVDDPAGRLSAFDGVQVVNYPAIAEADEPNRKEGEALFPEHKSIQFLHGIKEKMPASSWASLYQGRPYIAGGNLFQSSWWQYWDVAPLCRYTIITADTAQKTGTRHDYSVFQHWGIDQGGKIYLLGQIRGKWEAPELLVQARAFFQKTGARAVHIEDKVSGTGLIQQLRREAVPIVAVSRTADKYERANDITPYCQAGIVNLPKNAPWLSGILAELEDFPEGVNDDQVDCFVDAVDILSKKRTTGSASSGTVGGRVAGRRII